jgi:hypothetical protein
MSVRMYDNVDISAIKFDNKPYKKIKTINMDNVIVKSVYYIDISYKGEPLYIQIPKCRLESFCENDNLVTLLVDKYFYEKFLKRLETKIIDTVYNNSEKWFGGKRFTMNKISNCIVSFVEKISDDDYRFTISLGKNIILYDRCNTRINLDDIKMLESNMLEVVCILCIENLQFIDNLFTCNAIVEQLKLYKQQQRLVEYSIIESISENVSTDVIYEDKCTESSESILEDEYFKET